MFKKFVSLFLRFSSIFLALTTTYKALIYAQDEQQINSEEENISTPSLSTEPERWNFGKYRLRIGVGRPDFPDKEGFYQAHYGKEANYLLFGGDYNLWQKYVAIGVGVKGLYYTDRGHASLPADQLTNATSDSVNVLDAKTEFTISSIQSLLTLQASPFPLKYLTLDGWAGVEYLWFDDVRIIEDESADSPSTDDSTTKSNTQDMTKGARTSLVTGVALNILLNALDDSSVNSMRRTMGLGSVYISPFVEIVSRLGNSKKGINLDRNAIGISFTFESTR
ncbi:MAG: hypothetical protein R3B45_08310 [Bdellovibrionota bacterium]